MTAEEVLYRNLPHNSNIYNEGLIIDKMKEYALLKCKELLEIVAEKARVITIWEGNTGSEYIDFDVDKNRILNAVDLQEFIK